MTTSNTHPEYTRRQRVESLSFVGPTFALDWSTRATIIGRHTDMLDGHWYVVRFDDGGSLSVHASRMRASNEPAFKGPLPTYRQTQR